MGDCHHSLSRETETTVVAGVQPERYSIQKSKSNAYPGVNSHLAWDISQSKTAQCNPAPLLSRFIHPSSAHTSSVPLSCAAWTARGIGLAASEVGLRLVASKSTPSLISGLPNSFSSSSSSISMSRFVRPLLRSIGFGRENIDCPDLRADRSVTRRLPVDGRNTHCRITDASRTNCSTFRAMSSSVSSSSSSLLVEPHPAKNITRMVTAHIMVMIRSRMLNGDFQNCCIPSRKARKSP